MDDGQWAAEAAMLGVAAVGARPRHAVLWFHKCNFAPAHTAHRPPGLPISYFHPAFHISTRKVTFDLSLGRSPAACWHPRVHLRSQFQHGPTRRTPPLWQR